MLIIAMASIPFAVFRINATAFLQSLQFGNRASLYTFISHFFGLILWSTVLHFLFPDDPEFYQLSYPICHVWNILLFVLFGYSPIKQLRESIRQEHIQIEENLENNEPQDDDLN
jgi:hypothetical protein